MIKVIIVDDEVLLRDAMRYILDDDDDIEVIGTAGNGEEAITLCKNMRPDVVLMDIEMPQKDGVSATVQLKKLNVDIKILILTTFENKANMMSSFVAGADGYVLKSVCQEELILCVKCVASGLTVFDECVREIMIERFCDFASYMSDYKDKLNDDDIEIIKLIARDKNNKEIARCLNYSEGTIKKKISQIFVTLGFENRMQIALFAVKKGMV